jgi:very-short-patch-repair endonuclease
MAEDHQSATGDMAGAFKRSLARWLKSEPDAFPEPFESLDRALSWVACDEAGSPFYPGHQSLGTVALMGFFSQVEQAFGLCGSPIERMLLSSFLVVGHQRDYALQLRTPHSTERLGREALDNLLIQPQAPLGEHRVDFLLTQESLMPDFANQRTLADGMKIPGNLEARAQLVVECDGHDFHDRTKEQASRDRSRDRALQALGFRVYRYTGADLWRDTFQCAAEVLTHLNEMIYAPGKK